MVSSAEFSFELASSFNSHWFAIAWNRMFRSKTFTIMKDERGNLVHVMGSLSDEIFFSVRGKVTFDQLQYFKAGDILGLSYAAGFTVSSEEALAEELKKYGIRLNSREGRHEIAVCRAWLRDNMAVFDIPFNDGTVHRLGLSSGGRENVSGARIFGMRSVNTNVVPVAIGSYTSSVFEREMYGSAFVGFCESLGWANKG